MASLMLDLNYTDLSVQTKGKGGRRNGLLKHTFISRSNT